VHPKKKGRKKKQIDKPACPIVRAAWKSKIKSRTARSRKRFRKFLKEEQD